MNATKTQVRIFHDPSDLALAAAELLANSAARAVDERGRFNLVLSGGSTPGPMYRLLAHDEKWAAVPWSQTRIFWGDERSVPPDHAESNYGQAKALLLDHVPIVEMNVHRIKGELSPEAAAGDYRQRLLMMADEGLHWPRPDLVFLGLGDDGHTASLFPGVAEPQDQTTAVQAVKALYGDRPAHRVTLTPPVFSSARAICFLVVGVSKAPAVAAVLEGPVDPRRWPVHRFLPAVGNVTWLLDDGAAHQLGTCLV